MIDKNLKELFECLCKQNDELIESGSKLLPVAILLRKNTSWEKQPEIGILGMCFKSHKEKNYMRNILKTCILRGKIDAYVLFLDSILSMANKKGEIIDTFDVVVRSLYTPNEKISKYVRYKDSKIIKEVDLTEQYKDSKDFWDFFREPTEQIDKKTLEMYEKFKKNHPELYKDVSK